MNVRDMVLQRRLDYGFRGYEVPVVPRASRSARGRVPFRKKYEDNPVRAFEILASVAGELLQETGSSASNAACGEVQNNIVESIVEWEHEYGSKSIKADLREQGTCGGNTFPHMPRLQGYHQSYAVNEFSHALGNFSLKINSRSKIFDQAEKICFADQWPCFNERNAIRSHFGLVGGVSLHSGEIFRSPGGSKTETKSEGKLSITQNRQAEVCSAEQWPYFSNRDESGGPFGKVGGDAFADCKPPALGRPECNLKASLAMGCTTFGPFSRRYANIQVDTRDDEETSLGCTQPSTTMTTYRRLHNIVNQRVGNLSAARNYKVAPKLKGGAYSKTDWKRKQIYCYGRPCYTRQRSQRISLFKRRKLFDQIPLSASGGFQDKAIYNSPDKRSNSDNCFAAKGASPSVAAQQAPPKSKSRDCNVKLRIKSFKVPELFIEIPATATVSSLKRTVMEATTALLGDNLHVGILLQGKTVRDDSKTLLQTGICHNDRLCNLGFMLEPKNAEIMPPLHIEDPCLLSSGMPQDPTGRSMSLTPQPEPSDVSPLPPVMNMGSRVDNNINAVCSLADISTNNTMPDSQAVVAVPAIPMEALSMVPLHRKSRHSEFVQRRTRRPFSVSEVEALVQAVEKLGTGRWRDVKLRAFDSAKHRTYVDLKDKWKTLVHTARISPQQRRGEPVPQQLLDRVLAAHAYWSQHQAKQQLKIAV